MKTTDNQNEIFDIVDEEDNVIGKATRGEVHKNKKLIHRSVGVAVFNSKGEMFLQKRSATKDMDPLKWTISCSGHVISGDSYEETALRELKEELGLNIKFPISLLAQRNGEERKGSRAGFLVFLTSDNAGVPSLMTSTGPPHVYPSARKTTKTLQRQINIEFVCKYICYASNETEMQMLYKTTYDGPFKLHPQEISQGKFFTQKELIKVVESQRIILSFMGRKALEKLGWIPLDKK